MTKNISLLLCFLLLLSLPGMCSAEATYQITESELTESSQNLIQLRIEVKQLLQDLEDSNSKLEKVQTQLTNSQTKSVNLEIQLQKSLKEISQLKTESLQLTNSLQETNKSMTQYGKEVKSQIRKLTFERDILVVGIAAMFFKK